MKFIERAWQALIDYVLFPFEIGEPSLIVLLLSQVAMICLIPFMVYQTYQLHVRVNKLIKQREEQEKYKKELADKYEY